MLVASPSQSPLCWDCLHTLIIAKKVGKKMKKLVFTGILLVCGSALVGCSEKKETDTSTKESIEVSSTAISSSSTESTTSKTSESKSSSSQTEESIIEESISSTTTIEQSVSVEEEVYYSESYVEEPVYNENAEQPYNAGGLSDAEIEAGAGNNTAEADVNARWHEAMENGMSPVDAYNYANGTNLTEAEYYGYDPNYFEEEVFTDESANDAAVQERDAFVEEFQQQNGREPSSGEIQMQWLEENGLIE